MKRYSLDNKESPKMVRILQIIFGAMCITIAAIWAVYMTMPGIGNGYWIATAFIFFFGLFQIYSGMGYAARYIEIDGNVIVLKRSALERKIALVPDRLERVEILPLSIIFTINDGRRITIRFGMSVAASIDCIKDAVEEYATGQKIEIEERS
ncbi:MAG: hypothetical protein FJY11_00810, partial [Bacteroidetes bacterium]|nr:hypothetical protein [Bacteroidota bacterium]